MADAEAKDVPIIPEASALISCLMAHIASYGAAEADIRFAVCMELPADEMACILHFIAAKSPSVLAQQLAETLIQPGSIEMLMSIYANARDVLRAPQDDAWSYLTATCVGHPESWTTIHGEDADDAIRRLLRRQSPH